MQQQRSKMHLKRLVGHVSDLKRIEQAEGFAKFYNITIEEAQQRIAKWDAMKDDPAEPMCMGCAKVPEELLEYVICGEAEDQTPTEYVIENEGTYNPRNGHFLCDSCYIKNGQPSSSRGWVCP